MKGTVDVKLFTLLSPFFQVLIRHKQWDTRGLEGIIIFIIIFYGTEGGENCNEYSKVIQVEGVEEIWSLRLNNLSTYLDSPPIHFRYLPISWINNKRSIYKTQQDRFIFQIIRRPPNNFFFFLIFRFGGEELKK
jgi:hypothetical protein